MLPLFCTALWTPTKQATPVTCTAHPIRALCLERRKASYTCVLLVRNSMLGKMGVGEMGLGKMEVGEMAPNHTDVCVCACMHKYCCQTQ